MGEQEAKVRFSEVGSQQVVSAFRSVGSAAQGSAQQVTQGTSAVKQFGAGVKAGASGVAAAATAFATLSLSIVGTYRAYRDLTDAQIQVNTAIKKQHSLELQVKTLNEQINKERAVGTKGGIDYAIATNKIQQAEQTLAAHRKDHKHTAAELQGEELAIIKARQDLTKGSPKLAALEDKLKIAEEGLANQTLKVSEAHEHFNDVQQNFYLSLLPTALSSIATLTTAFSGLKGVLSGGGGLIGTLGPLGLGIGAISLGLFAWQSNLFGIQDKIKAFIPVLKQWAGEARDTVAKAFEKLRSGDFSGAFDIIKQGIIKWWADVKKAVPFFGNVENLVNAIRAGKWSEALEIVQNAVLAAWTWIKTNVPFIGDVDKVIQLIKAGKWKEAMDFVVGKIKAGIDQVFGPHTTLNIESFFQQMRSLTNIGIDALKNGDWKGAFGAITAGMKASGAQEAIDKLVKPQINIAADIVAGLTDFSAQFASGVANWINDSLNGPKGAINLVDWATVAFTMGSSFLKAVGAYMIMQFAGPIEKILSSELMLISSGKQLMTAAKNIGVSIWNGILSGLQELADIDLKKIAESGTNWLTGKPNADPFGTKAAFDNMVKQGLESLKAKPFEMPPLMTKKEADAKAKEMMGTLKESIQSTKPTPVTLPTEFAVTKSPELGKILANASVNVHDAVKKNPITVPITPNVSKLWDDITQTTVKGKKPDLKLKILGDGTEAKKSADKVAGDISKLKPKMPVTGDITDLNKWLKIGEKNVNDKKPKMQVSANTNPAITLAQQAKNKIDNMKATLTVQAQIKKMGSSSLWNLATGHAQHGMHVDRLRQDTMIMAHKNEYVHIDKPGKKQKTAGGATFSGGNGGGGTTGVKVRIEMQDQLKDFIRAVVVEDIGTAH